MKLLITGDLVINQPYETSKIDQSVIDLFKNSDLNIVNLEAPVTTSTSKIIKTGPHLRADEQSTLNILKALEVDVVTLANNHVKDYDEKGVTDTISFCKENNIKTVGAGHDLNEASKTLYIDTAEGEIAILNFAENEWASATDSSAGANPMDIIDNARQINDAKQRADFVFVIVHGGHEYYNLPSPRMQKQYRFYAEQGADIVIGHHTHCISGNEVYNGVPIYYSLGNFLFTKQNIQKDWYFGLILGVEIKEGKLQTQIHPLEQREGTFKLSLLEKETKKNIMNRVSCYNDIIADEPMLKKEWDNHVKQMSNEYLGYWSPLSFVKNRYISAILRRLPISLINKKGLALYLNLMKCQAHRDMSKEIIGKYLSK